ncbi:hypothetical protein [Streptomyces sp. NBC_00827]|uniref:hypothetical protein n=1 Tax=Streptomyces sp. NBC_00827 TaxID=2903677 RepID=UPI0038699646|nr:hypothetical protein OG569_08910 [Streptomyces sp. NBC_00827]
MHRNKRLAALTAVAVAVTVALTGTTAGAAPRTPHTEPISVTPEGKAGNGTTPIAVISRNGRHIALSSNAEDLDPNVPHSGMYVRDPQTGKLRFAGFGGLLAVLNDGRYVYAQYASSAEDTDVWIHDIATGKRVGFGIEIPEGFTGQPAGVSVSPNGRYAVYTLQEAAAGTSVVFLRDRVAGTTERISHPKPTWEPRATPSSRRSATTGAAWSTSTTTRTARAATTGATCGCTTAPRASTPRSTAPTTARGPRRSP